MLMDVSMRLFAVRIDCGWKTRPECGSTIPWRGGSCGIKEGTEKAGGGTSPPPFLIKTWTALFCLVLLTQKDQLLWNWAKWPFLPLTCRWQEFCHGSAAVTSTGLWPENTLPWNPDHVVPKWRGLRCLYGLQQGKEWVMMLAKGNMELDNRRRER